MSRKVRTPKCNTYSLFKDGRWFMQCSCDIEWRVIFRQATSVCAMKRLTLTWGCQIKVINQLECKRSSNMQEEHQQALCTEVHTQENWSLVLNFRRAEPTVLGLDLWQSSIMASPHGITASVAHQQEENMITQGGTRKSFWHSHSFLAYKQLPWKEQPMGFPLAGHLIKQGHVSTPEMVHSPSCSKQLVLFPTQSQWRHSDSSIHM